MDCFLQGPLVSQPGQNKVALFCAQVACGAILYPTECHALQPEKAED